MSNYDTSGMTRLMYHMATSHTLTMAQAIETLRQDAVLRSVRETIAASMNVPADQKDIIKARLLEAMFKSDPSLNRDSQDRKVRLWVKDDTYSISRDGALQIAFALHMDAESANQMMLRVSGEGFHWRNPRDLVYIYALGQNMDWQQMQELNARLQEKGLLSAAGTPGDASVYTEQVRTRAATLSSEAELEEFLRSWAGCLGNFHNTAHSLFLEFLNVMGWKEKKADPSSKSSRKDSMEDDAISVREVLDTYMHNDLIPRRKKAKRGETPALKQALDSLQKEIQSNWPDETALSRMIHREMDVSRKVLILLFLATDGGDGNYGDLSDEESPEEIFEDMRERMDYMLIDCGFAPLDSRSRFDWMVLYCMCADDSLMIDGRVQRFLAEVFNKDRPEETLSGYDDTDQ